MKPYDYKWTKFYPSNAEFEASYPGFKMEYLENELIICSTILDHDNFSILTTQKLITREHGIEITGNLLDAADSSYGEFKGHRCGIFTFGRIKLSNGSDFRYFIETGKASMIMIHGVRTVIRTQQMTSAQIEKVARIWNKQTEDSNR
ncbi:hypothetical protein F0L74_12850 [Chitinophaga agrisoli]|uniref:Uncharacterized protein n=1 Tax=Chitinophaga agrisoli TaxID=2607653 RepID=A0A5B2VX74_9BACT|nr:hypothetical protein [Chitinophaga agrisoli]KAA2243384.1 hypothetical protein F0L74_12850 [Chitinophaga agrisoli]